MLCSLGHFIVCRALHIFATQNAYMWIASEWAKEKIDELRCIPTHKLNIHAMHCWYLFGNSNSNNILFRGNSKWRVDARIKWRCYRRLEGEINLLQLPPRITQNTICTFVPIWKEVRANKQGREGESKKNMRARLFLFAVRSNYINNNECVCASCVFFEAKKQKHAEQNNNFDLVSKFTVDASAAAASTTMTAAFDAECLLQSTTMRVKLQCSILTAAEYSDLSQSNVYGSKFTVSFACSNGLQCNCKIAFSTQ